MSDLDKYRYALLSTRKKDGSFVDTPVWFAKQGKQVYMFSAGDAGKVKRLRNFSEIRLAPCTVSGKPLGEFVPASATLADAEQAKEAHRQLCLKYGWQMRLLDVGARLSGRIRTRAFILAELS